jgi:hypothetical protein
MYLLSPTRIVFCGGFRPAIFLNQGTDFLRIEPVAAESEKTAGGPTFIRHEELVYAFAKFS